MGYSDVTSVSILGCVRCNMEHSAKVTSDVIFVFILGLGLQKMSLLARKWLEQIASMNICSERINSGHWETVIYKVT